MSRSYAFSPSLCPSAALSSLADEMGRRRRRDGVKATNCSKSSALGGKPIRSK